jgi:hypothetical protein
MIGVFPRTCDLRDRVRALPEDFEYCSDSYPSLCNSIKILWVSMFFFFLLYFTTCFGLTDHHQLYKVCSRSLLCFPFDILDVFGYFIQVMLRHAFVSSHVFGLCLLSMLLSFSLVLYLLCLILPNIRKMRRTKQNRNI